MSATVTEADAQGQRVFEAEKPTLEDIAPLQRRRLSPLARVVFHCLQYCVDEGAQEALVYSSAMGELQRTQGLLESIAASEALSPAAFSLSVHNAIGGLWSQLKGSRAPVIALAPVANSPVPALLEAAGLLAESNEAVNIVFAEDNYPAFYAPWLESPPGPSALALRLTRTAARAPAARLRLRQLDITHDSSDAPANRAALAELLAGQRDTATVTETACQWQLEHR